MPSIFITESQCWAVFYTHIHQFIYNCSSSDGYLTCVVQPSQLRLKQIILVAASLSWLCTLTQTISYTKNKKCYVAFCVLWIPFNVLVNICVHLRLGHSHAMYIIMRERAHRRHLELPGHMNYEYIHISCPCLFPMHVSTQSWTIGTLLPWRRRCDAAWEIGRVKRGPVVQAYSGSQQSAVRESCSA